MDLRILVIAAICFSASAENNKCHYTNCHPTKEGYVNVHLIPHTHDDVGWLKTVDQYYFGAKDHIQEAGVQYILDSVMDALRKDKSRRFIYVETAFFWKWWKRQHDTMKHRVRNFVKSGQLEFISGGWSMNDEAAAHYQSIIDQFTWGLRKLNETFGECGHPKVGWQIDPFGHSREMASILTQLGFDGLLLGRIDYQDKATRFTTQTAESLWQGSVNLAGKLFTSVMFNTYSPPPNFCFDTLCQDEPLIDDKKSPEYNMDVKVTEFFAYLHKVTKAYSTNNIIITMGEDFNYQNANKWFVNLDKLILYGNQRSETTNGTKFNLFYSTPSCYVKAVHDDAQKKEIAFAVKSDDFFPYASDPHAYWTGYFTSRPTQKRFERMGNNFLQICKQLYSLTDLGPEDWTDLTPLIEAMGVMQHHDAITGTAKQQVADDYARQITAGLHECNFIAATALGKLVKPENNKDDPIPKVNFESCLLLNVSQCNTTEQSETFVVTVYNPLSRPVSHYVRLPVTGNKFVVKNPEGGNEVKQIIPIADSILNIPGRNSSAKVELVFLASDIPPLGFKSYHVSKTDSLPPPSDFSSLSIAGFKIDYDTGMIYEVTMNNKTIPLKQNFHYYRGTVGDNRVSTSRSSGAYIFRPNGTKPVTVSEKAKIKLYQGPLIAEVHQVFNEWVSQIIRVNAEDEFIEFDWLVGPIPIDDVNGKEVISRFETKLNSNLTFYTDSNGRETLKRVRNFRPTWKLDSEEPISSNYYPVTTKILFRDHDADVEVAVVNDRAQGGTSLNDGELELMIHRVCLHDDAFGVGESLMEEAFGKGLVVRGSHYLVVGPFMQKSKGEKSIAAKERDIVQRKLLQAWTFITPTNLTFDEYKKDHQMQFSGLRNALPDNVQILTLEPWKGYEFLLRLEHVLEYWEDSNLSKNVTIDLRKLFAPFEIISARETTLGANKWKSDSERFEFVASGSLEEMAIKQARNNNGTSSTNEQWEEGLKRWRNNQIDSNEVHSEDFINYSSSFEDENNLTISLGCMQIRTFIIEIKKI